jgi:hypothetical protein
VYIKKNKQTLCLVIALQAAILSACGGGSGGGGDGSEGFAGVLPVDPSTVSYADYYAPGGQTMLPHPSNWEVVILASEPEILAIFAEPAQGANDVYRENAALLKVSGSNLRDASGVAGIQRVSSRVVNIDGIAGEEYIFDGTVPGESISLRFMEISFEYAGVTIGLFYSGERSDFDRNKEVVRHMAEQIRFGQPIIDNLSLGSDFDEPGNTPVANDGTNHLIVSCRESTTYPYPFDLIGQLVGPGRKDVGPEILIHADVRSGGGACRYTRPRITFDGANFLVTYMSSVNDRRHIVAKRISAAGQLLDNTPIDVSGDFVDHMFEPAAVYTGSRHLVVWFRDINNDADDELLGAFVDPDGSVSPSFSVIERPGALFPAYGGFRLLRPEIALGQNQVMVVLSPRFEREDRQPERPIFAQLLDLNGNALTPVPFLIREDNGDNPRYPQVVSDGQSFVVVWIEGLLDDGTISSGLSGVYARQIASDGQIVNGDASTLGLEITPQSAELIMEDLNITFADNKYHILWSSTSYGTNYGTYGNQVSVDLQTITPFEPIAGTRDATRDGSMPRSSNPALSHTASMKLVVLPTRNGSVDGWVLPTDSP